MPVTPTDRCGSCGADPVDAADLVSVQRVYLVAREEGIVGAERVTMLDDIEAWCFVCRTMYPHEPINPS